MSFCLMTNKYLLMRNSTSQAKWGQSKCPCIDVMVVSQNVQQVNPYVLLVLSRALCYILKSTL